MNIVKIHTAWRYLLDDDKYTTTFRNKYDIDTSICVVDDDDKPARKLTPEESLILDIALSLWYNGCLTFTATDVLALSKGKDDIQGSGKCRTVAYSSSQVEQVNVTLESLRRLSIRTDDDLRPVLNIAKVDVNQVGCRDKVEAPLIRWKMSNILPVLLDNTAVFHYPAQWLSVYNGRGLTSSYITKYIIDRIVVGSAQTGRYANRRSLSVIRMSTLMRKASVSGVTSRKAQNCMMSRTEKILNGCVSSNEIPLISYQVEQGGKSKATTRYVLNFGRKGGNSG